MFVLIQFSFIHTHETMQVEREKQHPKSWFDCKPTARATSRSLDLK